MHIRTLTESDIDFAFECTQDEGWYGFDRTVFEDLIAFDPNGCFIAELDAQPVGICFSIAYQNNGFIGYFIMKESVRCQGLGSRLFAHSMEYLEAKGIPNIYLDGNIPAVPIYERYGLHKSTLSLRFLGTFEGKHHDKVRQMTIEDLNPICNIDQELFGDDRSFFLKERFRRFAPYCLVSESENDIDGYIFGYPAPDVIAVAPLAILNKDQDPLPLLQSLALIAENRPFRIGVLESHEKAVQFFRAIPNLEESAPCWRMVLGNSERLGNHENLWAIGSAAKG